MSLRSFGPSIFGVSFLATAALAGALVSSCSSSSESSSGSSGGTDAGSTGPRPTTTLFAASIKNVTVEIDYAVGAEPYFGTVKDFGDPWGLFDTATTTVFDGKKKVTFPRTLAKMEKLDDVPAKNFSNADILAIAAAHKTEQEFADNVNFYVVFLNGYWLDEAGAEQKDVLGVSIGATNVIALFKPAISTPAMNPTPPLPFVEQIALIHNFGHAVGFVDNGVPVGEANKAHIDVDNGGHHCTNAKCAMSFAAERASGAASLALVTVRKPGDPLIGNECLSDGRLLESSQLGQ